MLAWIGISSLSATLFHLFILIAVPVIAVRALAYRSRDARLRRRYAAIILDETRLAEKVGTEEAVSVVGILSNMMSTEIRSSRRFETDPPSAFDTPAAELFIDTGRHRIGRTGSRDRGVA